MEDVMTIIGLAMVAIGTVWIPLQRRAWRAGWDVGFGVGYSCGSHDEEMIQAAKRNGAYNRGFQDGYRTRYGKAAEAANN